MVLLAVAAVLVVATLVVAVVLLVRLVRTRRALRRAGLPTGRAWVFWGAIGYLVLPADLLPDPVLLDDIGVLVLALRSMRSAAEPSAEAGGKVLRTREGRSGAGPGGAADAPW
ncbi:YkvA family protein [Streptomyces aureocirculatus]|uniref:YkvA family protein n=1 Tax=Streptomyces aureocirculatus TaxID=67275 RepID=UPI00055BB52A|nr:YkvA family protein [Streptomyces aureocirculatus]